jgi:glycerol-3-phosphate acyltransferase PlsY
METLLIAIAVVLAFLAGSIPTAFLLGKLKGIDIRHYGSGNVGATNTFRVLGTGWGISCLGLDILKGFLPASILIAEIFAPDGWRPESWQWIMGLVSISGHMFSPFLKFRGGKGVATSLGVLLAIVPKPILIVLAIGIVIIWLSGYVSLASVVCAALLPALILVLNFNNKPWTSCIITSMLALVIIYKHRLNIRRLLNGTESRLFNSAHPVHSSRGEDVQS